MSPNRVVFLTPPPRTGGWLIALDFILALLLVLCPRTDKTLCGFQDQVPPPPPPKKGCGEQGKVGREGKSGSYKKKEGKKGKKGKKEKGRVMIVGFHRLINPR